MKEKKRKLSLDKVESGVKKTGKFVRILLRTVWLLLGVALIAGIVILSVKCGRTIASDVGGII